ncbi:phage tail-collar fiber domain-containing protein [Bosea minatitlanensis]|uniref:Phage tail protein n=1 Tax=Bosea minatitlanensis TaxID=128782 RepID=A0ABW0EYK5_9HYPH|nr:phage tail protein [Bosea minatitlanensis]MCT4491812.1 phage tail protein [Bosea minatitlanensis]
MTTGLLTTTIGQAAIATDLAGGADLVLSHVAFGDSSGVPYPPNEAQVTLVNERYRSTIASVAVVSGAIVVDVVLPADTPDGLGRPSHGFNVAEAGLFSADGKLIGVARMGNGYKPPPSSGQTQNATFRFKLPVSNPSAISVVIDPQAQVQLGRNVRPFWMTVDGVMNAPPGAPAVGATYVIGAAPTGAWAGFANRLAQWVGVWALASVPEGHLVCDLSKGEGASTRFMKRTAAGWAGALATDIAVGFARLATNAEAAAQAATDCALTPFHLSKLTKGLRRVLVFDTVGTSTYTPSPGTRMVKVTVVGGGGGGAGAVAANSGEAAAGNGGGGGGMAVSLLDIATVGASQVVTVGNGGAGAPAGNNNGGAGGSSSFGSLLSATGGGPGPASSSGTTPLSGPGGNAGLGSGGNLFNVAGSIGQPPLRLSGSAAVAGTGGMSPLFPAYNNFTSITANGPAGRLYGGGGSAGAAIGSMAGAGGGSGARGCVIVEEYE